MKAHSFARWLVLCVFLAAATNGSALAKLPAPTSTSELAAGEREAAEKTNTPLSPYHQFPIVVGAENGSVIEFGKVIGLPTNYGSNSGISIEIKGNQPLYPFELQPDGTIKVTQNYQLVEYYDGVYFTNPGSTNEDIVIYSLNDYYYLDPYEFVDVVIGENYGGAGYDKGDVLHVPVIMAMLITQAIENDRFDQNFRIATDIVEIVAGVGAIVAAAPTGGASLLLYAGIVESIAASADIAIASHQNTLPTAEYNANFYKSWQQVKMIVDIGSGIIAVPSMIQGGIKLGQSVFRYGENMASAISLRRAVRITNFANDVENIYDIERAKDISEAFSKGKKLEEVVSGAGSSFFKTVDDFAVTFNKNGSVSQAIRQQAFDLYNTKDWNALENLFSQNDLNGGWPPANGGFNIIDDVTLKAGMKFDRYGGAIGKYSGMGLPNLSGNFTSPLSNGVPYSFGQRALNQAENTYDFCYEIEVLNDLPFKGQTADVIPWFGQVGGGKQTMWKIPIDPETGYPKTWNKLAQEGYIKITIKDSPSGNYSNLIGTIIQQ